VDGFPVHAVMVGGYRIAHDIGTLAYHRVDGGAVHPTTAHRSVSDDAPFRA
jgi:hypothetical protein